MSEEGFVVREVMVGRKEAHRGFWIERSQAHQAINDRGRGAPVTGLDQQGKGALRSYLPGVKTLVLPGDDQQSLLRLDYPTDSALRAIEKRFAAQDGAELFGPLVTGDLSRQGQEALAVTAGENHGP